MEETPESGKSSAAERVRRAFADKRTISRLSCTERTEYAALDKTLTKMRSQERKRKEHLADVYDDERFKPLLQLHEMLEMQANKFRTPLYQALVSKCPRPHITAARLIVVLTETFVFRNLSVAESLIRKIVNIFQGTPFTKVDTTRYLPSAVDRRHGSIASSRIAGKFVDFREICCALRIFQYPQEEPLRRLCAMFDIFDMNRKRRLRRVDISKLFHIAAVSHTDHSEMARLVDAAFGPMLDGRKLVARGMFEFTARASPELTEKMQALCYARLPLQRRLELCASNASKSVSRAQFLRRKLQWRSVRSFYERNCAENNTRRTFDRWRIFLGLRRMLRDADAHRTRSLKRSGVSQWTVFVSWRHRHRAMTRKARAHFRRAASTRYFYRWYCVYEDMRARRVEMARKAIAFYRAKMLRRYHDMWWQYAMNAKAQRFRRRMDLLLAMLAWQEHSMAVKEEKRMEEKRAKERIARMRKEMERAREESELIMMEKEEDRMRELMRIEELEILQKQRDEEYAMKLDYATHRAHQRRLWRRQVEQRLTHKKQKRKQEKRNFKNTWSTLEERSMLACKEDTLNWIRETKEGRATIAVDAKKIYKVWNDCIEEFETPSMALWQGIFDPIYGTLFFFNTETKEKIGEKTFTMAQSRMVAIDHYLARQMEANVDTVLETKKREKQMALERKSATYIQDMWRSRKSRKIMREIVRRLFDVRYDVESGEMYYYHVLRQTKQQRKPRMLGAEKLEQPAFARIKDIKGQWIFHNTKKPWLSTPEKPAGYLLCSECNFFLARRYCKNCKERFCIDCYWNFHKKGKRRQHEWEKFEVKQQKCDFCKQKIACVLCEGCGGATYCEKCSHMVHGTGRNKSHILQDF